MNTATWFLGGSSRRNLLLVVFDAAIWYLSIAGFSAFRYVEYPGETPWQRIFLGASIAAMAHAVFGYSFWLYRDRFIIGSKDEALIICRVTLISAMTLTLINLLEITGHIVPTSIVFVASTNVLVASIGYRILIRLQRERRAYSIEAKPTIIFGAGSAGLQVLDSILNDSQSPYLPVAFLDDDPKKANFQHRGVNVLGARKDLINVAQRTGAQVLIIAVASGFGDLFRILNFEAGKLKIQIKTVPSLSEILDGKVGTGDLSEIAISDLLGRRELARDPQASADFLNQKRVLVIGAGGSIGSELSRQIRRCDIAKLIMLDRDESALHALQLSMHGRAPLDSDEFVLADIRDSQRLNEVFSKYRPQIVFHAAALKHLSMLEQAPSEAWKTNVVGTHNVLQSAANVDTEVLVNISTDKAANPISILGYSKSIAEKMTAAMAQNSEHRYVSVRFGNVLSSRGSVVTTFAHQIANGGPVTVTDPEITRYLMTIPEAVELVIQAGAMSCDGDVLILKMGEPVRILNLAQEMINLSNREIPIIFTGLSAGEKLHEELLNDNEQMLHTSNPQIFSTKIELLNSEFHLESKVESAKEFQAFLWGSVGAL